jgi:hypothetical protein
MSEYANREAATLPHKKHFSGDQLDYEGLLMLKGDLLPPKPLARNV